MLRTEKERVVAELTERLRGTDTLIVADYRGLTVKEVDALRTELLEHGARLTIVKNSLTRRAAEAAGADTVLALLEGPTAIAFLQADGDPVAVAKAFADTARTTRVLAVRGGVMEGRAITAEEIEQLAKLPPLDVLRGQVLGAITAPVYAIAGLFAAPLRDLHGLVQARIEQLGEPSPAEAPSVGAEEAQTDAPEAPASPESDLADSVDTELAETEEDE